jgi:hypothetical protein
MGGWRALKRNFPGNEGNRKEMEEKVLKVLIIVAYPQSDSVRSGGT